MTLRPIATGILSILFTFTPLGALPALAQYYDEFDNGFYDDLYDDIDTFNEPYYGSTYAQPLSVNYGSTYNDPYGNAYYGNQRHYNSYSNNRYQPQRTMPGFRCYYWGRDGSCMNYSYRQAPTYYGSPYGYANYGYQNYNYGYNYNNGCGYYGC